MFNNTNLIAQMQTLFDGKGDRVSTGGTPLSLTANPARAIQLEG